MVNAPSWLAAGGAAAGGADARAEARDRWQGSPTWDAGDAPSHAPAPVSGDPFPSAAACLASQGGDLEAFRARWGVGYGRARLEELGRGAARAAALARPRETQGARALAELDRLNHPAVSRAAAAPPARAKLPEPSPVYPAGGPVRFELRGALSSSLGRITSRVSPPRAGGGAGLVESRDNAPDLAWHFSEPHAPAEMTPAGKGAHPVRRACGLLRDRLRPFQPPRQRDCGRRAVVTGGPTVTRRGGRASVSGLLRCGSVHACAWCRLAICSERAEEIRRVVKWHGHTRTHMLTLTVRHDAEDQLVRLRRGVAEAWRLFTSGAPWLRWRDRVGLVGVVRALEVTVGPNGWHPHLHLLILSENPQAVDDSIEWISARWRDAVVRALGANNEPDAAHGTDLRRSDEGAARYISKLGLEIADPGTKRGKQGRRSAWELAADVAQLTGHEAADEPDVDRWREYVREIKGARQLTWSRGLKQAAGITERTDEEIVEDGESGDIVATIDAATWSRVSRVRGVVVCIIEAAERAGAEGVRRALRVALGQASRAAPRRRPQAHPRP